MRGSTHTDNLQEAKKNSQSRHYPVSARAYRKKDYEYLSAFPRAAHPAVLRASIRHDDAELSHDRSDGESDLFRTASSVEYATSVSSPSSTSSSAQSYARYGGMAIIPNVDDDYQHLTNPHCDRPPLQHHHHHQHHQHTHHHHHHIESKETSTLSCGDSVENMDLEKANFVKLENESMKLENESMGDIKDDKSELPLNLENGSNGDMKDDKSKLSPATDSDSVQVKERRPRTRAKAKSRQTGTPAVLPKFGSWDTKNPSSGEAYTLIFRRLRDEKKSGGLPVCGSPTHPKAEEGEGEGEEEAEEAAAEPLRQERKDKEPLRSTPRATKKDSSRTKAKTASRKEAAPRQLKRWISCCKPSVLDD